MEYPGRFLASIFAHPEHTRSAEGHQHMKTTALVCIAALSAVVAFRVEEASMTRPNENHPDQITDQPPRP